MIGRYVIVDHPPDDPRLMPRPQTVGRVASISDGQLLLEDHREGFEAVEASQARLSGSKVDFDWCVRSRLGSDAERVLSDAKLAASQLHSGPGRLKTIEETLGFLRDQALEAVPGVEFEISELLDSKSPIFPTQELIQKPSLVFDPSGTRTDNWNERGIKANGPYDQRTFTPKKLNIAVICQARYEGQVETFVAKFLEGMPDVKTGRRGREQARFGDGFLRRFAILSTAACSSIFSCRARRASRLRWQRILFCAREIRVLPVLSGRTQSGHARAKQTCGLVRGRPKLGNDTVGLECP